jgi:Asp-tRNA(Asn)/Glu-tRNA(Gln) amidotransferase A subunit family amidase
VLSVALARLEGHEGVEVGEVEDEPFRAIDATFGAILGWEAWQLFAPEVESNPGRFGPETLRLFRQCSEVTAEEYRSALDARSELAKACAKAYEGFDVLVSPAAPFVAPETTPPVDTPEGDAEGLFTRAYNLTGAPALVLPCGWAANLPVGLQLSAPVGTDAGFLAAASSLERLLGFRRPVAPLVELPAPPAPAGAQAQPLSRNTERARSHP